MRKDPDFGILSFFQRLSFSINQKKPRFFSDIEM